ncbi:MAG: alternative ribosome rescue aminoacyl-tRNA hydrolase ArfB [Anaerolineales bacterium]
MLPTPLLAIREDEIVFDFIRAAGPGGQNVNKVASAVQLRFDVRNSPSLPEEVKERLIRLGGRRVTGDGLLIIVARRYRTQEQNRAEALRRLNDLIRRAAQPTRPRRPTRPSAAARARRLAAKKRRAAVKRLRQMKSEEE